MHAKSGQSVVFRRVRQETLGRTLAGSSLLLAQQDELEAEDVLEDLLNLGEEVVEVSATAVDEDCGIGER